MVFYFGKKNTQVDSVLFCNNNSDCILEHCSNCLNKVFVKDNSFKCEQKKGPRLTCFCVDNVCKRHYGEE